MLNVCNIMHLEFNHVPNTLHVRQLLDFAALVDKYDVPKVIKPFVKSWILEL